MFKDPWNEFILYSCGHPCLRVWVGGFRPYLAMDTFCPTHHFIPPKNCPWQGGLWGKTVQLESIPNFRTWNVNQCCQNGQIPSCFSNPMVTWVYLFDPWPCKAKASKTTNERSVGDHFRFSHVSLFISCRAETVYRSLSLFDDGLVFVFLVCRMRRLVSRVKGCVFEFQT